MFTLYISDLCCVGCNIILSFMYCAILITVMATPPSVHKSWRIALIRRLIPCLMLSTAKLFLRVIWYQSSIGLSPRLLMSQLIGDGIDLFQGLWSSLPSTILLNLYAGFTIVCQRYSAVWLTLPFSKIVLFLTYTRITRLHQNVAYWSIYGGHLMMIALVIPQLDDNLTSPPLPFEHFYPYSTTCHTETFLSYHHWHLLPFKRFLIAIHSTSYRYNERLLGFHSVRRLWLMISHPVSMFIILFLSPCLIGNPFFYKCGGSLRWLYSVI